VVPGMLFVMRVFRSLSQCLQPASLSLCLLPQSSEEVLFCSTEATSRSLLLFMIHEASLIRMFVAREGHGRFGLLDLWTAKFGGRNFCFDTVSLAFF